MYQKEIINKELIVIGCGRGVGKPLVHTLLSDNKLNLPTVVGSNIEFIIDDYQDETQIKLDIETYSNLQLLSDIEEARGEE